MGSHFIANNLLHASWVLLFVNRHFVWSEIILIINFVNLTTLYFRHNAYPRFIHLPAVSGPLAWTFVAIYWNGAIMVPHQNSLVARIFANVFVWSILGYGLFFIIVYKDYTMGFALSVLSASLGVAQFHRQIVAFQWIFAFTIMAGMSCLLPSRFLDSADGCFSSLVCHDGNRCRACVDWQGRSLGPPRHDG